MEISNFDLIGFPFTHITDGFSFDDLVNTSCDQFEAPNGATCTILKDQNTAEIWLTQDVDGDPITANPVFLKGSLITARLDGFVPGVAPFVWYESDALLTFIEGDELLTRAQVLIVNTPSEIPYEKSGFFGRKKLKSKSAEEFIDRFISLRISVFSMETRVFPDEDAYNIAVHSDELPLASTSFIPSGLFGAEGGNSNSVGFGAGQVLEGGTKKSDFIGPDYHWAVVSALGGSFGVVWSPDEAPEPIIGGFITYAGSLIGKIAI